MKTKILNKIINHRYYDTRPVRFVRSFADIFIQQHVGRSAAALSYYITISVFPLLICATAILGGLHITEHELFGSWEGIVPPAALEVINDFLRYLNGNMSSVMLVVGITTMLTSTSAVFRTIMAVMGDIHGAKRFRGFWGHVVSFVVAIAFLAAVYVSGLLILTGEWFIGLLQEHVGLSASSDAWLWIRFLLLFGIMLCLFYTAYSFSAPRRDKRLRLPGALLAALCVVVVSVAFSQLISASTRYALVYGSLASIIILMTWIYMCALIFILGNVLNTAFATARGQTEPEKVERVEVEV